MTLTKLISYFTLFVIKLQNIDTKLSTDIITYHFRRLDEVGRPLDPQIRIPLLCYNSFRSLVALKYIGAPTLFIDAFINKFILPFPYFSISIIAAESIGVTNDEYGPKIRSRIEALATPDKFCLPSRHIGSIRSF